VTTVPENAKLELTAAELVYNRDSKRSSRSAAARSIMAATSWSPNALNNDQKNGRMMAFGDVEMIEPSGNRIYAEKVDVTNDFANGFPRCAQCSNRPNDTRVVAVKAERRHQCRTC